MSLECVLSRDPDLMHQYILDYISSSAKELEIEEMDDEYLNSLKENLLLLVFQYKTSFAKLVSREVFLDYLSALLSAVLDVLLCRKNESDLSGFMTMCKFHLGDSIPHLLDVIVQSERLLPNLSRGLHVMIKRLSLAIKVAKEIPLICAVKVAYCKFKVDSENSKVLRKTLKSGVKLTNREQIEMINSEFTEETWDKDIIAYLLDKNECSFEVLDKILDVLNGESLGTKSDECPSLQEEVQENKIIVEIADVEMPKEDPPPVAKAVKIDVEADVLNKSVEKIIAPVEEVQLSSDDDAIEIDVDPFAAFSRALTDEHVKPVHIRFSQSPEQKPKSVNKADIVYNVPDEIGDEIGCGVDKTNVNVNELAEMQEQNEVVESGDEQINSENSTNIGGFEVDYEHQNIVEQHISDKIHKIVGQLQFGPELGPKSPKKVVCDLDAESKSPIPSIGKNMSVRSNVIESSDQDENEEKDKVVLERTPSPEKRTPSPEKRSLSPPKRMSSRKKRPRSPSPQRTTPSPGEELNKSVRSNSQKNIVSDSDSTSRSPSPSIGKNMSIRSNIVESSDQDENEMESQTVVERTPSPERKTPSPAKRMSPKKNTPGADQATKIAERSSISPKKANTSPKKVGASPKKISVSPKKNISLSEEVKEISGTPSPGRNTRSLTQKVDAEPMEDSNSLPKPHFEPQEIEKVSAGETKSTQKPRSKRKVTSPKKRLVLESKESHTSPIRNSNSPPKMHVISPRTVSHVVKQVSSPSCFTNINGTPRIQKKSNDSHSFTSPSPKKLEQNDLSTENLVFSPENTQEISFNLQLGDVSPSPCVKLRSSCRRSGGVHENQESIEISPQNIIRMSSVDKTSPMESSPSKFTASVTTPSPGKKLRMTEVRVVIEEMKDNIDKEANAEFEVKGHENGDTNVLGKMEEIVEKRAPAKTKMSGSVSDVDVAEDAIPATPLRRSRRISASQEREIVPPTPTRKPIKRAPKTPRIREEIDDDSSQDDLLSQTEDGGIYAARLRKRNNK